MVTSQIATQYEMEIIVRRRMGKTESNLSELNKNRDEHDTTETNKWPKQRRRIQCKQRHMRHWPSAEDSSKKRVHWLHSASFKECDPKHSSTPSYSRHFSVRFLDSTALQSISQRDHHLLDIFGSAHRTQHCSPFTRFFSLYIASWIPLRWTAFFQMDHWPKR